MTLSSVATLPDAGRVRYTPYGQTRDFLACHDNEILLEGPAGTGKSYACLWKLHLAAMKYPGMRSLMVRKTMVSLTASALVTFTRRVFPTGKYAVTFFGGSRLEPAQFRYPNGSRIVVGGMDNADKIMSSEYDLAYVQEATELSQDDWQAITTRLRYGVMPYQQLLADCNPDAPQHWLNQRCLAGITTRFLSRHEDNPVLYDREHGAWAERGAEYMARLDQLTGVRYQRLRLGLWVAAEGQVYEGFDPAVHVIPPFPIPAEWPRDWVLDFGFTNPFVCQWWAEDPDGRLYLYRELFQTGRLVEDLAVEARALSADEPRPRAVIADHDAEGRSTFERHAGVKTVAANKAVQDGIQAVAARLRPAGDGKPRLFILAGATVQRDPALVDKGLPASTEEEFPTYVWDTSNNRKRGEEPVKRNDHGMDTTRYMVASRDIGKRGPAAAVIAPSGGSVFPGARSAHFSIQAGSRREDR